MSDLVVLGVALVMGYAMGVGPMGLEHFREHRRLRRLRIVSGGWVACSTCSRRWTGPEEPALSHHIPVTRCPSCQKRIGGATNATGTKAPRPGDYTICFYCAACLRWGPKMQLRGATAAEVQTAPIEVKRKLSEVTIGLLAYHRSRGLQ